MTTSTDRDLAELFREDGRFRYAVYLISRCNLSISFLRSDMPRPFNFVVFVLSARLLTFFESVTLFNFTLNLLSKPTTTITYIHTTRTTFIYTRY